MNVKYFTIFTISPANENGEPSYSLSKTETSDDGSEFILFNDTLIKKDLEGIPFLFDAVTGASITVVSYKGQPHMLLNGEHYRLIPKGSRHDPSTFKGLDPSFWGSSFV